MKKLLFLLQILFIAFQKHVEQVNIKTQTIILPQHFPYLLKRNPRNLHVFKLQSVSQEIKYTHLILTLEDKSEVRTAPKSLFQ